MEAHVAALPKTTPRGDDNNAGCADNSGASYANVVLNMKQTNTSNKENIAETPSDLPAAPSTKSQISAPAESQDLKDESDNFTPVPTHSRKDRKHEQLKKDKHKHLVNGIADKTDKHEKFKKQPKQPTKLKLDTNQQPKEAQTNNQPKPETSEAKKVFVAAPIPKVNAWQVKNTAPLVTSTATAQQTDKSDKRVLQPQKQETAQKPQSSAAVVKAPKDRRKFNKVRFNQNPPEGLIRFFHIFAWSTPFIDKYNIH